MDCTVTHKLALVIVYFAFVHVSKRKGRDKWLNMLGGHIIYECYFLIFKVNNQHIVYHIKTRN